MSSSASAWPHTLLLIPTDNEFRHLARQDGFQAMSKHAELCGFGPIAAAARTAELIFRHRPKNVLLVGIAGSYDTRQLDVADAACFRSVAIHGIGAGSSDRFTPASVMGFAQWPGDKDGRGQRIDETIPLAVPASLPVAELLLTCCAVSENSLDIGHRRSHFPLAVAEDMEGFGVALACQLAAVPLTIVRGISNLVGQRNQAAWKINEAMDAAWQLVNQMLTVDKDTWTQS